MKRTNSTKICATNVGTNDVFRELWNVRAALNNGAAYDLAKLAAQASQNTLASARRKVRAHGKILT